MMKKIYLLAAAFALPVTATAADKDSVYSWGAWSQNLQPAAGPVARVAPAPVTQPEVNFRPNENQAFTRVAAAEPTPAPVVTTTPVTPAPTIDASALVAQTIASQPNVVEVTPETVISTTGPDTGGF